MSGDETTTPWEPDKAYFKLNMKGHDGYEAALFQIGAGTIGEFRRSVALAFGWDPESEELANLSAVEIAFNATQEWHAMNNAGRELKGTRATGGRSAKANAARSRAFSGQEEQPAEPPDPKQVLIAQLGEADSVDVLQELYADNVKAFDDPDVLAAYKARGKELTKKEGK